MTLTEALAQLRAWCELSRGAVIEIAPNITGSFQSRATFGRTAVREIEMELGCELPLAYYEFMAVVVSNHHGLATVATRTGHGLAP